MKYDITEDDVILATRHVFGKIHHEIFNEKINKKDYTRNVS
jgi:hypothetical protein